MRGKHQAPDELLFKAAIALMPDSHTAKCNQPDLLDLNFLSEQPFGFATKAQFYLNLLFAAAAISLAGFGGTFAFRPL